MKNTNQKGITLIALIVTIIVLVIIAGISIAALTQDNGIIRQVNTAKVSQIEANAREQVKLACSAMRLAIAEASSKDNSYKANANVKKIQDVLLGTIKADTKELEEDGWIKGTATTSTGKFEIIYEGDDYKNACNYEAAKITYTITLGQKSIEVTDEGTGLKDSDGNDVNIDVEGDSGNDEASIAPGLYQTGSNYTVMTTSWDKLISDGTLSIENGVLYTMKENTSPNTSSDALVGDLVIPSDGSITAIGGVYTDLDNGGLMGMQGDKIAFSGCQNLTSIKIPNSVKTISTVAFAQCTALSEIEIPDSVEKIGFGSFIGCTNLTNVKFVGNVKKILNIKLGVFAANGNLSTLFNAEQKGCYEVTIYGSPYYPAMEVGKSATLYINDVPVNDLQIINNVQSIGDSFFALYDGVTELNIPNTVTNIGKLAFTCMMNVTNVNMPDSVTSVGLEAFSNCPELTNITLSNNITSIPQGMSYLNSKLKTISFSNKVESIGNFAFYGCSALERIDFKGTRAEWNAISLGTDWNTNTGSYIVYCTDGALNKDGTEYNAGT